MSHNKLYNTDEDIALLVEEILLDNDVDTDIESDVEDYEVNVDNVRRNENISVFDKLFQEQLQATENLPDETTVDELLAEAGDVPQETIEDIGIPGPSTSGSHKKQKSSKDHEPERKWEANETASKQLMYLLPEGPVEGIFVECESATDYFVLFIRDILETLCFQSNLYAVQRNKILNITENELLAFFGINFLMGYVELPSWKDYWSTSEDLGVQLVQRTMARNRFDIILRNLHIVDNSKINKDNTDRLAKLRPFIECLNKNFNDFYHGTRELSVDESMILFKGRSTIKQYNPMKPIKRGYKLWCLADQRGYIKHFSVYQGRDEATETQFSEYGLGERVVLSLTKKEWHKNRIIYFDNYFTSIKLLERLKTEETLACGTVRAARRGTPKNLSEDKKMKRGDFDFRITCTGVSFFKWLDKKPVFFASNFHGSENTTVPRKDNKGVVHDINCPTIVRDYNKYMGGVDHADQLRSAYGLDRKSKKWWHRIFWGVLEIAFVNSYIVYCEVEEKITLLQYRRAVSCGLMNFKEEPHNKSLKRKSPSTPSPSVSVKRRGKMESVPKDVRLGNLGVHFPIFGNYRGRCEMCSLKQIQSRPYSKCSRCGVFLCCNDKKNCFIEYHGLNL